MEEAVQLRADLEELKTSVRELANVRVRGLEGRAEDTKLSITELRAELGAVKDDVEKNTRMTSDIHAATKPFLDNIKDPDKTAKNIIKLTDLADSIETVWKMCVKFREQSLQWMKWLLTATVLFSTVLGALTSHRWGPAVAAMLGELLK